MSDYKNIIDKETRKFLEYARQLKELELNFRTYINEKGLSEESYRLASNEYSTKIKSLKLEIDEANRKLSEITEETNYANIDTVNALDMELGKIWRIIILNETFVNEYGGVQFSNEPEPNTYKEIYDEHLEKLKEFMNYFIKSANNLFSK